MNALPNPIQSTNNNAISNRKFILRESFSVRMHANHTNTHTEMRLLCPNTTQHDAMNKPVSCMSSAHFASLIFRWHCFATHFSLFRLILYGCKCFSNLADVKVYSCVRESVCAVHQLKYNLTQQI